MRAPFLRRPVVRAALFVVVALLASTVDLAAQTVQGSLVESDDGAPINGATVILLDQGGTEVGRGSTDAQGAFQLEAPAAGIYMVMVEREGYANHLTDTFALAADETYPLDLTLRSQHVGETGLSAMDTLEGAALVAAAISNACRDEFVPGLHGIAFGIIRDEESGDPIPGAAARLRWKPADGPGVSRQERTTRTDEVGAYLVCDLPAGRDVEVTPTIDGIDGDDVTFRVRAGTMSKHDLTIPLSNPDQPGNILGHVTDNSTGQPLAGATIRLRDAGRSTVTNSRGVFILGNLPAGLDVVEVEMLGYADHETPVRVVGGRAQDMEVRLTTRPVELPPIMVTVRPRTWFSDRSQLESRIELGNGIFLTRPELEKRAPVLLGDALRGLPGVQVIGSGGGLTAKYTVQLRGAANLNSEICQPMVWVDGVKWGNDGSAFNEVQGWELDAVEIYRGASEVPGEFAGGEARCGVIVVWTRRGR